jgi:hypothetical protein
MKTFLLIILFSNWLNPAFVQDSTTERQIQLINHFIKEINNDSLTIANYIDYFGCECDWEGYNLDIQCYKRNLSEDSCMLFQKNYCNNPQNISFTLVRLRDNYFVNSKIKQIEIEKSGTCSVYKVTIEYINLDNGQIDDHKNNKLFYFVIVKRGRNPDYIMRILDECLNSIMVG